MLKIDAQALQKLLNPLKLLYMYSKTNPQQIGDYITSFIYPQFLMINQQVNFSYFGNVLKYMVSEKYFYFHRLQTITSQMGRGKKNCTSKRSPPPKPQVTFGRPEDGDLETFFMSKLRNGKLQEISAQSEAQIDLFSLQDDRNPKSPVSEEELIRSKIHFIKQFFKNIDQQRFNLLWSSFSHTCKAWTFKEINTIEDFPQYLFLDECDLSYVIHGVLTSQTEGLKNKITLEDDELLFLELICLASRNQVSFRVLESIKDNKDDVLREMLRIKDSVKKLHSDFQKNKYADRPNPNLVSQNQVEEDIPNHLRQGNIRNVIESNSESQQSSVSDNLDKTKTITKQKKKGRPKKVIQGLKNPLKISFSQLLPVLRKLIDHISYAYAYVYEQQFVKTKSQQRMQGVIQQCID